MSLLDHVARFWILPQWSTDKASGMTARRTTVNEPLVRELLKLVEHAVWANSQWVEFVYSQPNPEARPRELLAHILVGDRIWFERIEGQQTTTTFFPLMEQDDLLRGFALTAATFRRLIATRLEDDIQFRRATGVAYHARVVDIIHHLLTHGYHHRGQLAAHYARTRVEYPNTDHINFLVEQRL